MDDLPKPEGGKAGGKTVGVAGGSLTVWLTTIIPDEHVLKPYAIYSAPVVAVFCKEWGGMLVYQIKVYVVFHCKHFMLKLYKRRVDKIPDHPDFENVKKEANKDYIEAIGGLLKENIKSLKNISNLVEDKDFKSEKNNAGGAANPTDKS